MLRESVFSRVRELPKRLMLDTQGTRVVQALSSLGRSKRVSAPGTRLQHGCGST